MRDLILAISRSLVDEPDKVEINEIEGEKIKLSCKQEGYQFYDEDGKDITTEEYLELLLKQKRSDMDKFLNKMRSKKK
jgi:hypothetical protein